MNISFFGWIKAKCVLLLICLFFQMCFSSHERRIDFLYKITILCNCFEYVVNIQVPRWVTKRDPKSLLPTSLLGRLFEMCNCDSESLDMTFKSSSGEVKTHSYVFVSTPHVAFFIFISVHRGLEPVLIMSYHECRDLRI